MRKHKRRIAKHLMEKDGMKQVNKPMPKTRRSYFSIYWRDYLARA